MQHQKIPKNTSFKQNENIFCNYCLKKYALQKILHILVHFTLQLHYLLKYKQHSFSQILFFYNQVMGSQCA